MKKGRKSSIKTKILIGMVACTVLSLAIVGAVSVYLNYTGTIDALKLSMSEIAQAASSSASNQLEICKTVAAETGSLTRLSNDEVSALDKKAIIDQKVSAYGFVSGDILNESGFGSFSRSNYSDTDYFKKAMQGQCSVSEPVLNKDKNELVITVAAPLWENGVPKSRAVGAVIFVTRETFLNDIVVGFKVGSSGGAYMLNKSGFTIAHKNIDGVKNRENTQEDAKKDPSLNALAALEKKMTLGEQGCGKYSYGGVSKFLAYAPISGTDGWSIAITAPLNDFMATTYKGLIITIIMILLALAACVLVSIMLARKIAHPLRECTARLQALAEGDIYSPAPDIDLNDETGDLARATKDITVTLGAMIGDIKEVLGAMANGDLTRDTSATFPGDLLAIKESITQILVSFNKTLIRINQSSNEVAGGANQVSDSAQALSQGATEQASAVEELSATITGISERIAETSEGARLAKELSAQAGESVSSSNEQMQQMISAMKEIADTAGEIGKIIKAIDDIAFQTNILALNAAVEAARAGQAGKGFAVVADEVRNLAGKSAAASKNTTALIESAISAVNKGTAIADETAESLNVVVSKTNDVVDRIQNIATAAETQATEIMQVSQGIQQISAVVQTNSATAQESAAASQELSGQSQILKELIDTFTLDDDDASLLEDNIGFAPPAIRAGRSSLSVAEPAGISDKY